MLTAIAIVPSAPVLVPRLAGAAADELTDLRAAVFGAAAELPPRWVVVGVDEAEATITAPRTGTFAGYGVDERVSLSPAAGEAPVDLPLCALIGGWVRGQAHPDATADVRVYPAALGAADAHARGRALRAGLDAVAEPVGVLLVADGAHTLSPSAPGGHVPESVDVQRELDDALAAGDAGTLRAVPAGVVGRVAHQVLAGLEPAPAATRERYRGAPYGVGYFVGVWTP